MSTHELPPTSGDGSQALDEVKNWLIEGGPMPTAQLAEIDSAHIMELASATLLSEDSEAATARFMRMLRETPGGAFEEK